MNPVSMINQAFHDLGMQPSSFRGQVDSLAQQLQGAKAEGLNTSNGVMSFQALTVEILTVQVSIQVSSQVGQTAPAQNGFSPLDFSPEATAQRILDFSTSMFSVYQAQNPDESAESALADFEQLVRDAIDEGFGQARDILGDMGRLDESTSDFIDQIYSFLDKLLQAFFESADSAKTGEQPGQVPTLPTSGELLTGQFELSYQHLFLEQTTTYNSLGQPGGAIDSGNQVTQQASNLYRMEMESLRIAMSFTQENPEPGFQSIG